MTTISEQRLPLLERSIDTERLILSALVLTGWALATIGRDLILPLLRLALRWREEPPAPAPAPAPAPMITSQSEEDFPAALGLLQATGTISLRRMAQLRGIEDCDTMEKAELIDALADATGINPSNDYSREVPTPAERNRARGL
jgi:hypothetical protein